MNELSIRLSVLNSKTFATKVIADIVSNGSKVKTYEQRLFNQISQPNIKRMAEDIKKLIDTNYRSRRKQCHTLESQILKSALFHCGHQSMKHPDK